MKKAIYSIVVSGNKVPVLESNKNKLIVINQLIYFVPGHVNVEKDGEDDLYINDVWDINRELSKQTLNERNSILREDIETNEY